ncbi:MAG: glycosyltransferase family 4 protein [Gemmatimonadota bacterium]
MASGQEPYLVIVRLGPVHNVENHLLFFARAFAPVLDGEIATRSGQQAHYQVGRFKIRLYAWGSRFLPEPVRRILYTARVVGHGLRLRWLEGKRLVVITYDPFQSGVIGLLLKWLTGAAFICEVNGVFGDPNTLIDLEDQRKAERKRKWMLRVGSWMLRRADFIKLLYPGQLMGFMVPADRPPRASFHELIHTAAFEPTGRAPEDRLIFVGHPYLLKGVDLLLEAFARVAPEFPGWRLLVVGWRIEESARGADFPRDRVEFRGPSEPPILRELIEGSSALVLPSRSEGMGRVLLEAAFLGRARIGSTAGGIPHVVEDGEDGLLFRSGDVNDLVRALRRFMGLSPGERARMGAAARKRALESFTTDAYVRHYLEIIRRVAPQDPADGGSALH